MDLHLNCTQEIYYNISRLNYSLCLRFALPLQSLLNVTPEGNNEIRDILFIHII